MMTPDVLLRFCLLLIGLIVIGFIACLPLFKWNVRELLRSSLFIKIIWWVPIFIILTIILYGGFAAATSVAVLVSVVACLEYARNRGYKSKVATVYFVLFLIFTSHLALWFVYLPQGALLLAAVCLVSVISDVMAFFLGNYAGKHKLPRWINDRKAWEGVAGQIVGAGIGALLAWWVLPVMLPGYTILAVGVASAIGDLINSIAKRNLHIKDWGQTIPGHGGMLDRMSSLSAALAVSLWLLILL